MFRLTDAKATSEIDALAVEAPVEFRLGSTPIAVLMRTPGMDRELGLGFALTEAIVSDPADLIRVDRLDSDRYRLVPARGINIDPEQFRRNTYTTSSCGVCGKASIDAVRMTAAPLPAGPIIDVERLEAMSSELRRFQQVFDETGGLHGAALFGADGELLSVAEDVGRHNAVDKAIGALAARTWRFGQIGLMVSGRVSFEIMQKAAVVGIPLVAGVSAASSLAVELADEVGATLVGFVRERSAVVYAGENRLRISGRPIVP